MLDGFPRTVGQADALAPALESHARELTTVVLIDVPDEVAAVRISGRDEGREDDNPETVRARLRVYHDETEPLVAYYEERGLLLRVDGAGTPDDVNAGDPRGARGRGLGHLTQNWSSSGPSSWCVSALPTRSETSSRARRLNSGTIGAAAITRRSRAAQRAFASVPRAATAAAYAASIAWSQNSA